MTKITRLHLRGFKSFAKPTDLEFVNGFNCIIGANGSGKSNVGDSVCFVLGKISAKSMRAEKSANLIFNGGKKGSPLKEAEVSLFFDNSDKEFPIEAKEIKISRIVRHNGNSIYKINDEVRTREQIVELLSRAKIDPDGHNIVMQGDIVHFMEMRTEERRAIIEDIAGMGVFDDKKHKALLELEKVEKHLNEATIILTERETYLRELKKERDQAQKYKTLESNIKSNKATYLHMQLEEKLKRQQDIDSRLDKVKKENESLASKIEETKKKIEALKQELATVNKNIEEKGEKESIDLQRGLEQVKTENVRIQERLQTCKNEIEKILHRKQQLQHGILEAEKNIADLEQSKNTISSKIKEAEQKEKLLAQKINAARGAVAPSSMKELEEVEHSLDKSIFEIEDLQQQKEQLLRKKFAMEAEINTLKEKISFASSLTKGKDPEKLEENLGFLKKEILKCTEEESLLSKQIRVTREELVKHNETLFTLRAKRGGMLSSVASDAAVKKILGLENKRVYGTISQLMTVDDKYGLAVEVAAGPRMKAIVVEDDKTAADCIRILKEQKLGVASFLPLNKIKPGVKVNEEGKGIVGSCLDILQFDKQFKPAFSYVFASTLLVDNLDTARRVGIGKCRMVTLDGDVVEMSGAMVGGFRVRQSVTRDPNIDAKLKEAEDHVNSSEKLLAVIEKRRYELLTKLDSHNKEKSEIEAILFKAEKGGGNATKLRQQLSTLENNEVFNKLRDTEQKISKLQKEIDSLRQSKEELKKDFGQLIQHKDLSHLEQQREKIFQEINSLRVELKNVDLQVSGIYQAEKEKSLQLIKQHEKELKAFQDEEQHLSAKLNSIRKELQEREQQEKKFQQEYKNLFTRRNQLIEQIQKHELDINKEQIKVKEFFDRINDISISRAKIVAEVEALQKEFDEYRGVELRQHISFEKLKSEISEFERMLKDLGNVNLRALEVYEEVKKEYDELLTKVEKIRLEKDDVLRMIAEIEGKKKDIFLETFEAISKNFTQIFSNLTTKGQALLELEDPENPLADGAGVEIRVQISGNKFLDIKSLSGGEKTLAALAFIFAIQEYKPASFYFMDEVDAALDKANSNLLSKLIAKYSKQAQYILISHNDAVITEADTVYGVSMQESGMSKVVSLKL